MVGSNHKSYTAAFKLTVVARAEEIGNRAAAREFSVDPRCVRRWRNEKEELESMPMTKKAQRGCTATWPELETELASWIKMHRGESPTVLEICNKAKLIAEQKGFSNFKGTVNWCYRFMRRKQLSRKLNVKPNSQGDSSVEKSPLSSGPADLKLSVIQRAEEVGNNAATQEFKESEGCVKRWRTEEDHIGCEMVGSNYKSYTAAFKLTVVARAEEIGNRAAGREFSVDPRCVRRWRNDKEGLESMPQTKKAQRGCTAAWPELETELASWIKMHRGESLSVLEICTRAKLIAEQKGFSNFKGTGNWCYRFMRRKQLSRKLKVKPNSQDDSSVEKSPLSSNPADLKLSVIHRAEEVGNKAAAQEFEVCECCVDRWRSEAAGLGNKATRHVCQKIHNEQKLSILKSFVFSIKEQKLTSAQVMCVGEIPFSFHFVNGNESNGMPLLTANGEKVSFTCVLSCAGIGYKLKPFLVFKRNNIPDGCYPEDVIISANELGSLCPSLVLDWILEVWSKRKVSVDDSHTLLLVDFKQRQPFECAKSEFEKVSTTLVVVPEELTDIHPLPLRLSEVFEREMMKCYEKWLNSGLHSFTRGGKMRKALPEEIAKWVSESWESVEVSTVVSSFQKTGIVPSKDVQESNSTIELHETEGSCKSYYRGKDKSNCDQSCIEIEDDEFLTYLIASDTDQSEADEDD